MRQDAYWRDLGTPEWYVQGPRLLQSSPRASVSQAGFEGAKHQISEWERFKQRP